MACNYSLLDKPPSVQIFLNDFNNLPHLKPNLVFQLRLVGCHGNVSFLCEIKTLVCNWNFLLQSSEFEITNPALEKKTSQFSTNERYFSLVSSGFVYNFTFSFFVNLQDLFVHTPVPGFKIGGWDPTKLTVKVNIPPTCKNTTRQRLVTNTTCTTKLGHEAQLQLEKTCENVMHVKMNKWLLPSDWSEKGFNSRIVCRIVR